ncbi:hypothetical protein ATCV1_z790L [Acanthocystis turfacea chlorella virus 1]|uniref:Uncharacterized protein z790L n=1 Tax=Chlorovirus heliozoae TaxID=322019 RepID=A7KA50_9PHYC|nr:hypothetical protein ATCV1_z790L [Acanthocystis turfacea chlorella virus 1]ABT16924.1 hypothetical protein ATCV1_z790L [Acanthocystis turfacea chlorella virus 1]
MLGAITNLRLPMEPMEYLRTRGRDVLMNISTTDDNPDALEKLVRYLRENLLEYDASSTVMILPMSESPRIVRCDAKSVTDV